MTALNAAKLPIRSEKIEQSLYILDRFKNTGSRYMNIMCGLPKVNHVSSPKTVSNPFTSKQSPCLNTYLNTQAGRFIEKHQRNLNNPLLATIPRKCVD